jgi:exopolysaccharide biosynthesis protein
MQLFVFSLYSVTTLYSKRNGVLMMLANLGFSVKKVQEIFMFLLFVVCLIMLSSEPVSAKSSTKATAEKTEIISRAQAIKTAKSAESGKVVSIKLVQKDGSQQYWVRILTKLEGQKKVKTILIDAVSGRVIKVKD